MTKRTPTMALDELSSAKLAAALNRSVSPGNPEKRDLTSANLQAGLAPKVPAAAPARPATPTAPKAGAGDRLRLDANIGYRASRCRGHIHVRPRGAVLQIRMTRKAADLKALQDFVQSADEHETRLLDAETEAKQDHAFFEFLDFLESNAGGFNDNLFPKTTKRFVNGKIRDSIATIQGIPAWHRNSNRRSRRIPPLQSS